MDGAIEEIFSAAVVIDEREAGLRQQANQEVESLFRKMLVGICGSTGAATAGFILGPKTKGVTEAHIPISGDWLQEGGIAGIPIFALISYDAACRAQKWSNVSDEDRSALFEKERSSIRSALENNRGILYQLTPEENAHYQGLATERVDELIASNEQLNTQLAITSGLMSLISVGAVAHEYIEDLVGYHPDIDTHYDTRVDVPGDIASVGINVMSIIATVVAVVTAGVAVYQHNRRAGFVEDLEENIERRDDGRAQDGYEEVALGSSVGVNSWRNVGGTEVVEGHISMV